MVRIHRACNVADNFLIMNLTFSFDSGIKWLLKDARPDDSLFLHYSGHGGQTPDKDGDEEDGMDECICPVDYKSAGTIIDDDLKALFSKKLPRGVRDVIL